MINVTITIKCECGNERTIDTEKPILNLDDTTLIVYTDYDPRLIVHCKLCNKDYSL